ncbi:nuclear pore complex protein NUP1 [Silene latifolia]|uniref:nuclear pore complex protein NUP1 n=1 Tax=Silene latifolia TaxID=37657 RepID=UPI003D7814E5
MADGGEPPSRGSLYGGERNTGVGKIRKERKPPSTPYARPPLHRRPNGWISRIVDPAKRLLSDGATRFLPSLFSPSPLPEEIHSEEEHATEDHNESISANLLAPPSSGGVGSSAAAGNLKPDTSNTADVDKRREHSDGALPDIEQLIKGKTFSRKEIDHLMEILRSRVDNVEQEVKAANLTELQGVERAQTSKGKQKAAVTETEEVDRFQLASTPLQRPSLQSEIGASPVDIARAYMGSRASEVGLASASLSIKNEKWGHTNEFLSKPISPSPLPKAPICWPGAVTQNQEGYSTPQNQKSRYGLHSFSRTPYSRTMYTKSKSKLTPVKGDSERLSNLLSTPLQPTETPGFGKSISRLSQGTYGSGGPIRRTRNKSTSAAPAKESPLVRSIHRSPFAREFNADHMIKKNVEPGNFTKFESTSSKLHSLEVGIPSVHPYSSKLARQILEHIDRPVTLKEKSKELKLATSFKTPPVTSLASRVEDGNQGTAGIGVSESVELVSTKLYSQSNGGINGFAREKNDNVTGKDVASGSKVILDKTSAVSDGNDNSSRDFSKLDSRTRSQEQETKSNFLNTNMLPSDKTKGVDITLDSSRFEPLNSTQRKPFLPSIAVGKSELRNPFSSDTTAAFSFPVTTSTNTYFDLPTPTVMPSSLTSSPQKPNISATDSKITIAPPVYSLPPTSATSNLTGDVGPKFKFGSGKARLSFAIEGDDGASSSDAPSISYKFGSGKSRLNFGSIASYAVCL